MTRLTWFIVCGGVLACQAEEGVPTPPQVVALATPERAAEAVEIPIAVFDAEARLVQVELSLCTGGERCAHGECSPILTQAVRGNSELTQLRWVPRCDDALPADDVAITICAVPRLEAFEGVALEGPAFRLDALGDAGCTP